MTSMGGAVRHQGSNIRAVNQRISGGNDPLTFIDNEEYMASSEPKKNKRKRSQEMPTQWKVYQNPDKTGHTKPPDYNLCQPGHPSRIIVVGKPGCGKRSVMYNILENYNDIEFDTVTEVHASANSEEHDIFQDPEDDYDYQCWQWSQIGDGTDELIFIGTPPISALKAASRRVPDEPLAHHGRATLRVDDQDAQGSRNTYELQLDPQQLHDLPHHTAFPELARPSARGSYPFYLLPHTKPSAVLFYGQQGRSGPLFSLPALLPHKVRFHYGHHRGSPRVRRNVYEVIQGGEVKNELEITDSDKKRKKNKGEPAEVEDEVKKGKHGKSKVEAQASVVVVSVCRIARFLFMEHDMRGRGTADHFFVNMGSETAKETEQACA